MPPVARPPILLAAGETLVRFEHVDDRWHHVVTVASRGSETWHSVEGPTGGGDDRWPASPVFVEVTRLGSAPDSPVMAVGQAGRTHFSAVILPDAARPGAVRFDLAARVNELPRTLGSTYRFHPSGAALPPPLPGPFRVAPIDREETLPRTVRWSYRFSAEGLTALEGTSLPAAAGSDPRDTPAPA